MKIAIWFNLPSGGGSKSLQQHIKMLAADGHKLKIWCPPTADLNFLDVRQIVDIEIVPLNTSIRIREQYKDYWRLLKLENHQEIRNMETHAKEVARQINQADFEVVYLHSCQKFFVPFLGKYLKKPSVLFLHEPNRLLYEAFHGQLAWIAPKPTRSMSSLWDDFILNRKLRVMAREERINYDSYAKVLVNSLFSLEAIQRVFGQTPLWCGMGIDTTQYKMLDFKRENVVLGLGTFYGHKNHKLAIEAIAEIQNDRPKLVWIGNDQDPGYIEHLKAYALSKNVDFEPLLLIPDHEVVAWLNRAKVLIYTSKLEPLGLAPLEAQACGLPVVAIEQGGNRETVLHGKSGFLTMATPTDLAKHIKILFEELPLWQSFAEAGQRHISEKWSVKAMMDRLTMHLTQAHENR